MFGFFKKLISLVTRKKSKRPLSAPPMEFVPAVPVPPADYALQKKMMVSESVIDRKNLALSPKTHPEILYFLSADRDPDVRLAVASNSATPLQASALLAKDPSLDVRLALAGRLTRLLPGLSDDQQSQLYAFTVQALGILAEDEVLKIRKALSTALKDFAKAPPRVAGQLARDIEREVSEPILRFCVALSDDDLLDILSGHPEPWVISAIAGRETVSDPVALGIIDSNDVPAGTALIKNKGANFSEETLRKIVEKARNLPEWHEPIVMRKELSLDIAAQLSGFVSATVMAFLEKRTDFDAAMRKEIAGLVARRIQYRKEAAQHKTPEQQVAHYAQAGRLTADIVRDALAWGEKDFVTAAMAYMARIPLPVVKKMLATKSAKPAVALSWRVGLPMRTAIEVQKDLAGVPPAEILYAKGGTDYPLDDAEIRWQLEFFGINPS